MSENFFLKKWLALYHAPGIGSIRFQKHIAHDPELKNLPPKIIPNWQQAERDLNWLACTPQAQILTLCDPLYPSLLKQIADPPPVLYVLGDVNTLNDPQIAIVGSRTPTSCGIKNAFNFAKYFAARGIAITSGLAIGIDGMSHRGALTVPNAKTIAVLAHGLEQIYPLQHADLAAQIIDNGCLVSEFGIGSKMYSYNFPQRNRIISGLSLGVLVVEAALSSGSLITARYAADQGRDVFTIPGSIHSLRAKGCHALIKQGAKLVESAEEVLIELAGLLQHVIRDKTSTDITTELSEVVLTSPQQRLLSHVDENTTSLDVILARSGLPVSVVGTVLLELELQGLISAVPGGYSKVG